MAKYALKLYVTGQSASSNRALRNLRRLLEREIPGEYELSIVDVLEYPAQAEADKIFATPTLIKQYPPPARRIIGDLSNAAKTANWLGLQPHLEVLAGDGEAR